MKPLPLLPAYAEESRSAYSFHLQAEGESKMSKDEIIGGMFSAFRLWKIVKMLYYSAKAA